MHTGVSIWDLSGHTKLTHSYLLTRDDARDDLHETYAAHNAQADVCLLQKLFNRSDVPLTTLSNYSATTSSCLDKYKYEQMSDDNLVTIYPMQLQKIIGKQMAVKIAQSGLIMEHLRLSVKRKGYEGLRYLLS